MRLDFWTALAAAASLTIAAPAGATTLLEQPADPSEGSIYSDGTQRAFDDFSLAADATVGKVTWWSPLLQSNGVFEIQFTTADGWYPGAVLYTATVTPTVSVDGTLKQFEAVLPIPVLLSGGVDLFLSIYAVSLEPSPSTPNRFRWSAASDAPSPGSLSPGMFAFHANGSPGLSILDAAWRLEGPVAVVPEPGAWAMMIAGFGLVGGLARRRRIGPAAA